MQFRLTRILVVVLGISVAGAGCGKYSINNLRAMKAFSDANHSYQRSDYKAAATGYENVIRLNPDFGYAYFFLGNSYDNLYKPAKKGEVENEGYLTKAIDNYKLATEKLTGHPEDPRELDLRKRSFEFLIASFGKDKMDDFSQAEPIAKQLIAMEPNEPLNYQTLGRLYEEGGRYDEAEAQFKKAIDIRPNDPVAHQLLAGYYHRQGQFDNTIKAFEDRARVEPNNPEAWHTISTYLQEKSFKEVKLPTAKVKEYVEKGIAYEDKALSLNPEYVDAMFFKQILMRQKALYEKDHTVQQNLLKQADEIKAKALEIQKKQTAAGTTPKKGGGN
jgi:tetratricopeptide (TPR) repeat protein